MQEEAQRKVLQQCWLALFLVGLAISVAMLLRCQVGYDQLQMLSRGWLFAAEKFWLPIGNETSAGGYEPGGLAAIIVGLPLKIWMHHRSPVVLILLCHIAGYLLIDRIVGEAFGLRGRVLYSVLYWVNPWRVYHSAFLWNPNYLFLIGALLLWACMRQRHEPRIVHSTVLVATAGLAVQLHPGALIPIVAAVLMWLTGYWRPHWGGVAIGAAITIGSLVPWIFFILEHPAVLPGHEGYPFRNLVRVLPVIKGIVYWLRFASFWVSSKWMARFDFTPVLGASADVVLWPVFAGLTWVAGPLTIALSLIANVRFLQLRGSDGADRDDPRAGLRRWMRGYVVMVFLASVILYALSPTTVMAWQCFPVMHAAVLPPLFWLMWLVGRGRSTLVNRGVISWCAVTIALLVAMTFASQMYTVGGRDTIRSSRIVLRSGHPMLEDLKLGSGAGVRIDSVAEEAIDLGTFLEGLKTGRPAPSRGRITAGPARISDAGIVLLADSRASHEPPSTDRRELVAAARAWLDPLPADNDRRIPHRRSRRGRVENVIHEKTSIRQR